MKLLPYNEYLFMIKRLQYYNEGIGNGVPIQRPTFSPFNLTIETMNPNFT